MILVIFDLKITQILPKLALLVQEKKHKIDFQDGGHLGFPIRMILTIFYLSRFKGSSLKHYQHISFLVLKIMGTFALSVIYHDDQHLF